MSFTSDFMDMDYQLAMRSLGEKTIINSNTTCKGNSGVSRSLIAFMGSSIKGQEETNLANLKKTIETNTKEYFNGVN